MTDLTEGDSMTSFSIWDKKNFEYNNFEKLFYAEQWFSTLFSLDPLM